MTDSPIDHRIQTHLTLADSKEKSLNFQDAIKEYMVIYKKYDHTTSQKKAAIKVARLNIHPNNSNINYKAALDWLQIYSNLQLTPEEEENALILAVLIRQINLIEEEKAKLASQIKIQKNEKVIYQTKLISNEEEKVADHKKLLTYEAEKLTLEKELSILKEKLQKIKDIDVQMHETRKNNTQTQQNSE